MAHAQPSQVWVSDNLDGTFSNPVLHSDYSDPDAIRVGEDYYMISSSFNHIPGLPILHSKDLVNWQLITHALKDQIPEDHFNKVQHGMGVWAPSLRYHNNRFYIYYPDPDFGIYMITAKNILGPWSLPHLVESGKGLIDPCPLWDTDGKMYMVHAYAGSRAGIKSIIVVKELSGDGKQVMSKPVLVYDGHAIDPTIEGPKFYKRNNYYYIFAPAGGVTSGWQVVLRSKKIYGPYERKIVMQQGTTSINGPHQGAWITTSKGDDWFLHFQDKLAYGRVVHLQPMKWVNDWPIIGIENPATGIGEPTTTFKKPLLLKNPVATPPDSDEFNSTEMGLQWQWQANPGNWAFPSANGYLRFNCVLYDSNKNFWNLPAMLLQKFPAEDFVATTKITFKALSLTDRIGLIVFGSDYAFLSLVKKQDGIYLTKNTCVAADKIGKDEEIELRNIAEGPVYLRVTVNKNALCTFSYSVDGNVFATIPGSFAAKQARWVGAKIGFFCTTTIKSNDNGYAEIDWIRFTKIK